MSEYSPDKFTITEVPESAPHFSSLPSRTFEIVRFSQAGPRTAASEQDEILAWLRRLRNVVNDSLHDESYWQKLADVVAAFRADLDDEPPR